VSPPVVGHRFIATAVEIRAPRASLEDVELPMAACALDESGLRLQLERDAELVEQAIAIERECDLPLSLTGTEAR
jgi:hypothetical protein